MPFSFKNDRIAAVCASRASREEIKSWSTSCAMFSFIVKVPRSRLVVIAVVLVPVVLGAPAVLVLVPPAMLLAPAALAGFVQFPTLVIGLPAVASVFLDGFVEFMLGVSHSTLTAVDVFGVQPRYSGEKQSCRQECTRKE